MDAEVAQSLCGEDHIIKVSTLKSESNNRNIPSRRARCLKVESSQGTSIHVSNAVPKNDTGGSTGVGMGVGGGVNVSVMHHHHMSSNRSSHPMIAQPDPRSQISRVSWKVNDDHERKHDFTPNR